MKEKKEEHTQTRKMHSPSPFRCCSLWLPLHSPLLARLLGCVPFSPILCCCLVPAVWCAGRSAS